MHIRLSSTLVTRTRAASHLVCWLLGLGLLQHLAAGKGHLECVALLVERGAKVNVKGNKSGL